MTFSIDSKKVFHFTFLAPIDSPTDHIEHSQFRHPIASRILRIENDDFITLVLHLINDLYRLWVTSFIQGNFDI